MIAELVFILLVALWQVPTPPPAFEWRIAQRFDDTRVVVLINGGELYLRRERRSSVFLPSDPKGVAALLGSIADVPADRVSEIVGSQAAVGDRWRLDAGRGGEFVMTVERLVIGHAECGEGWGVLLAAAAEDAPRLAAIREKYFIAQRATAAAAPARPSRVGPIAFTLTETQRGNLVQLLDEERTRIWPDAKRAIDEIFSHGSAPGVPARWRALDALFEGGEGRLDYDIQAFRLTPDGEPRLFVRAAWRVGQQRVFLMSAWVRVGRTLAVERSDARASRFLRFTEFGGASTGREALGRVLGVVDADRDGWAEVLIHETWGDGSVLDAVPYPRIPGAPRTAIARLNNSC